MDAGVPLRTFLRMLAHATDLHGCRRACKGPVTDVFCSLAQDSAQDDNDTMIKINPEKFAKSLVKI